jgi:phospholipase/carboxylesterase
LGSHIIWGLFVLFEGCARIPEVSSLANHPHPPQSRLQAGAHKLGLGEGRDGLIFIPAALKEGKPAPLIVALHGAGQDARFMERLIPFAEEKGIVLLIPESRGRTWDFVTLQTSEDVQFIDNALKLVFDRCLVDSQRIALSGFSDGASYALSLGLVNDQLFTHLIAFSPGFLSVSKRFGSSSIFISHGLKDRILPFEQTSEKIVSTLSQWGYDVRFRQFEGGHTMSNEVISEALDWFLE